MSGNNWLERDPKDSPGLQRIREAQQAAAAARAQEARRAREAEIRKLETEQKRLEMIARIEQKTAQVLPLLEEIRDFANETGTYPCGDRDKYGKAPLLDSRMEIIKKAIITEKSFPLNINDPEKPTKVVELKYGYRGWIPEYSYEGGDGSLDSSVRVSRVIEGYNDAVVYYGIALQITGDGIAKALKKEIVHIPYREGKSTGWTTVPETLAHDETQVVEVLLPEDIHLQKDMLSAIFHDPVHLGTVELPPVRQNKDKPEVVDIPTDIFGSIRALLGIKS